ncbi:Caspase Recruitment and Peptidase C14 domain containing protein [Aphelenchoides besseyi]|nr:Caspase Recruitment and Peptidase C14 domain containing protein [Aphelenchoides besseyi]
MISSPRRSFRLRRQLMASSRQSILERIEAPEIFLVHFRWLQQKCQTSNNNENINETDPEHMNLYNLIENVSESDDLEIFILCLLHFGHYSLTRELLNEIDLEKLTDFHHLTLGSQLFSANSQLFVVDQLDKIELTVKSLTADERFELRSLIKHRQLIRCKLIPKSVLDYFRLHFVLSDDEYKEIESLPKETQADRLVSHLLGIGEQGRAKLEFARFCHSLLLSGQFELFAFVGTNDDLNWELSKDRWLAIITNTTNCIVYIIQNNFSLDKFGIEQRRVLIKSWRSHRAIDPPLVVDKSFEEQEIIEVSVDYPDTTVASDLSYYKANRSHIYKNFSVPKGLVLLITNEYFRPSSGLSNRPGTARDAIALNELFQKLGYSPADVHQDVTGLGMLSVARQFVKRNEHRKAHSCVVIVQTHGEQDLLVGVDGDRICVHDFLSCFNSKAAPFLAGKPKLFFIQACRGYGGYHCPIPLDELDARTAEAQPSMISSIMKLFGGSSRKSSRSRTTPSPSPYNSPPPGFGAYTCVRLNNTSPLYDSERHQLVRQPVESDFLIAFSTAPRYVSWRNNVYGAWFVQAICEVFGRYAATEEISKLLVRVHAQVSKCESSDPEKSKQIPEHTNRLLREFYFFPGITSEE